MSKRDKLLKDLENNPYNVRFETLKNLLENAGYSPNERFAILLKFTL